jgi:hypothetical protein
VRPVYAPALVAFVGGVGFGIGVGVNTGPVGWFPLGPRDVYVPWYHASHNYFTNVNVRNTTIVNNTYITNVYNNYSRGRPLTNANYAYRQNVAAVTAVPRDAFVGARPVNAARVQVNEAQLRNANVATRVGIAPTRASFVAANAERARVTPTAQIANRNVIARTAPPPRAASVDTRIAAIQKNGAQPLATRQLRQIGTPVAVAAGAAGAAAIATRGGGNPRVQLVGQNAQVKPQPLPLRAAGAQTGTSHLPGPAANTSTNPIKPGTPATVTGRTPPTQTITSPRTQVQDRTVTRGGNDNVGKGNATGNPNATGLPSSGFAPHKGPPPRATGQTSTPNTAATTNNNTHQLERKAVTGRTQTPTSTTGSTVHKAPVDTTNRTATVHRTPPPTDTSVQSHARTTTQGTVTPERSVQQHRVVSPTGSSQQQVESKTVNPHPYTPRTAPVEHTQSQVQRAPQPQVQVQHAPTTQVQHAPPQVERRAPPPQKQTNEKKKDKDDENGHR